jgi:hypothetical protein
MLSTQSLRTPHNQVTRLTATSIPLKVSRIGWLGTVGRSSTYDYIEGFRS